MITWLRQYEDDKYEAKISHAFSEENGEVHFVDIYQNDIFNEDNFVDSLYSDTDD